LQEKLKNENLRKMSATNILVLQEPGRWAAEVADRVAQVIRAAGLVPVGIHLDWSRELQQRFLQELPHCRGVVGLPPIELPLHCFYWGMALSVGKPLSVFKLQTLSATTASIPPGATQLEWAEDESIWKPQLHHWLQPESGFGPAGSGSDVQERFNQIFGELLKLHGYQHRGTIRQEGEKVFVLEDQELPLALVQQMAKKANEFGVRLKLF
jgi:hypothetical protein